MFWRILKKDLKRKKTMNVIVFLFVIICSTFASASINNIVAVTNGVDHFYEISDVPDIVVTTTEGSEAYDRIVADPSVTDVQKWESVTVFSSKSFVLDGKKLDNFINPAVIMSDSKMLIKYYDEDNKVIDSVEKGKFYCTNSFLEGIDLKKGDKVTITQGDTSITLEYAGPFKGAMIYVDTGASPYFIINHEDYDYLDSSADFHIYDDLISGKDFFIRTDDISAIEDIVSDYDDASSYTPADMKAMYMLDMVTAYIMMVISILLMVTAFVVLRFTTGFTISEEFREIGVMKAVGITNPSIRRLFIVKYFAIAVVGAVIGFIVSIPLANFMLKTISKNMVLDSGDTTYIGVVSSVLVVVVIMLFCYNSTSRIKKLSPIDAVRNGQTGERFKKRSVMHLSRSKSPSTSFLAMNDIASAPKRFIMITVIIALGMLMTSTISAWVTTLNDNKMLPLFSIVDSDATIMDTETIGDLLVEENGYVTVIDECEQRMAENGISARCAAALLTNSEVVHGDNTISALLEFQQGNIEYEFSYDRGSAPTKPDEVAVTRSVLKELDAEIGDTISIKVGDEYRDCIITGEYSSFASPGIRFMDHYDLSGLICNGCMGLQVKFNGDLSSSEIKENIEKLKDIFETDKIWSSAELVKLETGIGDTLATIKVLTLFLTIAITAMVVVLMERSFISREKSELALMKAVGIPNFSIIAQHTLRFVIVTIVACILSALAVMPLTRVSMNFVCAQIGDVKSVDCSMNPWEVYLALPMIIVAVTIISAFLTATYTRTIKASDTASIE